MESRQAEPSIPKEYQDLAEVFSEQESNILPHYHPADCAIELLPRAKLPKRKMYSMTPREMKELCNFVDKNLAGVFIHSSRVAAPVLIKEKKTVL